MTNRNTVFRYMSSTSLKIFDLSSEAIGYIAKRGVRAFLKITWAHFIRYILNRRFIKIMRFSCNYLSKKHYFSSVPRDELGITPWFTYPAISMIRQIVSSNSKVFEYGSGYSTLFFNSIASETIAVEHNSGWADFLRKINPELNLRIHPEETEIENFERFEIQSYLNYKFEEPIGHSQLENIEHGLINRSFSNYALEITKYPPGHFDIIVVDGMARQLCAFMASLFVAHEGVIILDNSDRWQYNDIQKYLLKNGFGRIDFWGPGPINTFGWCTSFFSRKFIIPISDQLRMKGSGDIGW